jgi:hypothetical protein
MGSKTMLVKGAGSQGLPVPLNTAPQCGSGGNLYRGQILPLGVVFGVAEQKHGQISPQFKGF